jgi:Domain of unknown function (DUF4129)
MQRSRTAWAALALVVVTGVLAVVAAAVGGPWTISDRGGLWRATSDRPAPTPSTGDAGTPAPTVPPLQPGEPPRWFAWALLVVTAVAAAIVIVWLWRSLAGYVRSRREPAPVEAEPVGEVYPDAPVIRAGLTSALDELSVTVNPTDAVLRAWVALEAAAARSGVARQPANTPTEFTARVLQATSADHEAVDSLLKLYHQARFSWHGLSSADRARARGCLEGLSASWSAFEAPPGDAASQGHTASQGDAPPDDGRRRP